MDALENVFSWNKIIIDNVWTEKKCTCIHQLGVSTFSITGIPDFEDPSGLPSSEVLSNTSVTLCPGVPTPMGTGPRADPHNKGSALCYFTQILPCRVNGLLLWDSEWTGITRGGRDARSLGACLGSSLCCRPHPPVHADLWTTPPARSPRNRGAV